MSSRQNDFITGVFDSWDVIDKTYAIKQTDKSFYDHNGTGIPKEVRGYFDACNISEAEHLNIVLLYNSIEYEAYIAIDSVLGRARMFWRKDLAEHFAIQRSLDKKYPALRFERIKENYYKIEFVKPHNEVLINNFEIGRIYNINDLKAAFGGSFSKGINYNSNTYTLVLISKHLTNRIYGDEWQGGCLLYTGEGQKGDQTMTGGNKRIAEAKNIGLPIYLFEVFKEKTYTYYGMVELVGEPYFDEEEDINKDSRKVIRFPLRRVGDDSAEYTNGIRVKYTVDVVGAAIKDSNGNILCAQRANGSLKGKWEFPGGKIEDGETPIQALKREIREELGVDIVVREKIDSSYYAYPEMNINLSVYACELAHEVELISSADHQKIEWVNPHELDKLDWASADAPIKDTVVDSLPLEIDDDPLMFNYLETKPATKREKETLRAVQDYEKSQKKKKQSGDGAEKAVIKYVKDKLYNRGRPDLADLVRQVSKESSDYGYDILSWELVDGVASEVHIEVKAAKYEGNYIEFFISANELSKFKSDGAYRIYCLIKKGNKYKLHEINKNDFFNPDYLTPLTYKVRIRVEERALEV